MKKVLILGVAAVQYDVIKFLKDNYTEIEIHAIAMKNDGPGSKIADFFTLIDILDIEKIEKYIKKNIIDVVYSVGSDISMPIIAKLSEKLGMPHFISSDTAVQCNNKNNMRSVLGSSFDGNIPFQELASIKNFNESIFDGYPLFLKPADSQGQRGVKRIDSLKDLYDNFEISKSFSKSGTAIIERYISGQEISVNGYMINGVLVFSEITDRETWNNYEGLIHKHLLPSKYKNEIKDKVDNLMLRVATKMGILNGPIYAQLKIEKNIPYIIEITPRLDGCHMWKLIHSTSKINLLKLTIEHLLFNNVSEIEKKHDNLRIGTLEFLCQKPNTEAHYPPCFFEDAIEYFRYYSEKEIVKPVNGVYDKIGYKIVLEDK